MISTKITTKTQYAVAAMMFDELSMIHCEHKIPMQNLITRKLEKSDIIPITKVFSNVGWQKGCLGHYYQEQESGGRFVWGCICRW